MEHYYIEIRYFGKAKYNIRNLIHDVARKFGLRKGHKVPHITVIQPFATNKNKKLISDFKRICRKYKLMKFTVDGFSIFPFFVVFAKVNPNKEVIKFRHELLHTLKRYCKIKSINRPYKPHTTIALKMGTLKCIAIWLYLQFKPRLVFTNHVMRVTLLKGSKIYYEYDFLSRKLLNRRQAKSRRILVGTFRKLKKTKK